MSWRWPRTPLVSHVVTSLVLPHVVTSQNEGQHCSECASDDDSNFGWDVIWCTLLGEGERSDNVTKAKRDYSNIVRSYPAVQQRNRRTDTVGEVVANQEPNFVVVGQKRQETASQNTRAEDSDYVQATLLVATSEPSRDQNRNNGNRTGRKLQQGYRLAVIPESFDDCGLIAGDSAVRDICGYHDQRQEPGLRVHKALQDLLRLHGLIFDTGLEENHQRANANGDKADDQEEDLPAGEGATVIVLETEAHQ
ncbi:hypothetical protein L1887_63489 [Cichorium endivia]|nr:hypothetical protein L1887_63489 [Cichorium endivia]